ncbi:MAG: UDP-3-O-(3-hydroxymyristoyl)glucosamine N-acyltransferase [Deltaproteobacteria bacterium]|nr:MAG: UDP-3-O-(3-hydroxymyristoyl)glucosamine N-acyltransferase [Deltaproteobacteria bacterium]
MQIRVSDLAKELGCSYVGEGSLLIKGAAPIEKAGPGDLTFLSNVKYKKFVQSTRASAIVAPPGIEREGLTVIISDDPYYTFARALWILYPREKLDPFISPLASVSDDASVSDEAVVMDFVRIGEGAVVERGAVLYPGVYIGKGVTVGEDSILYPNVVVYDGCRIGKRVIIHSGAVIGSDGFGFAPHGGKFFKIPQVGTVVIEDDVEIGAGTTIDRAALGETRIGEGTKIDNLVQVAHNVEIGKHTVIASQTGISGSVKVGDHVMMGGQVGVAGHLTIDSGIMIGAKSGVPSSLSAEKSRVWSGIPAIPHRRWLRLAKVMEEIPDLLKRVRELERVVGELKKERGSREDGED